jgi:hypothetical protein
MSTAAAIAAAPSAGEGDSQAMNSLKRINGLSYLMAPSLSVVTTRTVRQWPSSQPDYDTAQGGQQTLTYVVSSGAAYVDARNSCLKFQVTASKGASSHADRWGWGRYGSALNLFETIRLTHSSGYVVEIHQDSFGEWCYLRNALGRDKHWRETVLPQMQGHQQAPGVDADTYQFPKDDVFDPNNPRTGDQDWFTFGQKVDVVIPLSELSDIFANDALMPSFLLAGMRIELVIARNLDSAIQGWLTTVNVDRQKARSFNGNGAPGAIKIEHASIQLETITLTDAITRSLAQMSANQGLTIPFTRLHSIRTFYGAALTGSTIQVNRALSRANAVCVAFFRNVSDDFASATPTEDAGKSDFLRILPADMRIESMQVKLGAEFYPSKPLQTLQERFQTSQVAWGAYRGSTQNSINVRDYLYSADVTCTTLEKSSTLSQSGQAIAANRDMNVELQSSDLPNKRATTFVPHVAILSIFLDSVTVRS